MSRFRRRLMGLAALRQAKADDFVRVEYIENTSNAYINTGYKNGASAWSIDATISFNQIKTCYLYGGRGTSSTRYLQYAKLVGDNFSTSVHMTTVTDTENPVVTDKKYHLNGSVKSLTIDYKDIDEETQEEIEKSFTITNSGGYVNNGQPIYIFACYGVISVANNFNGKLYGFKLYNASGTLIRDYIPMYQISTDTYGLWDRVNEEFYTSPNGVKFTGGERVIADADDNLYYIKNYISSNNTVNAYITLRKFKNTDNVEFEIYKKQNADSWFGSRQGSPSRNLFALNAYGGGININWGQQSPTRIVNGIANGRKHKVRLWDREVFVNGTKVYTCGTNTFTTNTNVTLGKVDGITTASNCNWYYFKWWNVNKDLVYDLIPVQSVDSGLYGMFDKVNLQFHSSDGTAEFTGG